jgi:iron complex outermembrane recepter protein
MLGSSRGMSPAASARAHAAAIGAALLATLLMASPLAAIFAPRVDASSSSGSLLRVDPITATLEVRVTDQGGAPLVGASVVVMGTPLGAVTDGRGLAVIRGVPTGPQRIRASRLGYAPEEIEASFAQGDSLRLAVTLRLDPTRVAGVQVSVLRPDLRPEVQVSATTVQEANPHDVGAVMRTLPGLDAIRRGGLGLDPVVRGLRDTQVGAYVDGMRTLPGGPGGMDTPLSHIDPSAVRGIEVVKGPYALTWGTGNLSAIRVETDPLPARGSPLTGRVLLGADSNLSAREAALLLGGSGGDLAWQASGGWRTGDSYTSGAGELIPGAFTSGEIRGKLGFDPSVSSRLTLAGWYQAQRDIDYPGRPLDADWFDTWNASLRWDYTPLEGRIRAFEVMSYAYTVDHGMNNDKKPTALPNPQRMPPFPQELITLSRVEMVGGRMASVLEVHPSLTLEIGGDGYSALHQASATNRNRDTGVLMMERIIWGDARLSTLGLFTRAEFPLGRMVASGTVRLDHVRAQADTASAFFLEHAGAGAGLGATESHMSGAFTLTWPVRAWASASVGAGSVIRPADANERYSDRAPSKRSQISAEFLGDPSLRAERSQQVDLWLDVARPRWAGALNVFAQWIEDHITIEETDLPRQSAMSAPTVYRYVNGSAHYRGAEASATVRPHPHAALSAAASWLWAEDRTLGEPALGVSPFRADLGVRWNPGGGEAFLETSARHVGRQDRVSATRGEGATAGYETLDVQAGLALPGGVFLRTGIQNLFDQDFTNHLNARNPFTRAAIAEPGRVFFMRLSTSF